MANQARIAITDQEKTKNELKTHYPELYTWINHMLQAHGNSTELNENTALNVKLSNGKRTRDDTYKKNAFCADPFMNLCFYFADIIRSCTKKTLGENTLGDNTLIEVTLKIETFTHTFLLDKNLFFKKHYEHQQDLEFGKFNKEFESIHDSFIAFSKLTAVSLAACGNSALIYFLTTGFPVGLGTSVTGALAAVFVAVAIACLVTALVKNNENQQQLVPNALRTKENWWFNQIAREDYKPKKTGRSAALYNSLQCCLYPGSTQ